MPTTTVNGISMNYVDEGAGPVLLLVHGFPLDHTMWQFQIADFKQEVRVIAPDLRGFGATGVTSGTVSMRQMADDLAALLDALKITEPVFFCGLSMGGYVAWQFIERHAHRLAGVILCDTRAQADTPKERETRLETADKVLKEGPGFLADSMPKKLFSELAHKEQGALVNATKAVIRKGNPEGVAAAARGMAARPDVRDRLPSIELPALVIVGTDDAISTADEMREIAEALPVSMFTEVPGAGHMSPLEAPDVVNTAILEFVQRMTMPPPEMEADEDDEES